MNSNSPCQDRHLPRERGRVQTEGGSARSAGDAKINAASPPGSASSKPSSLRYGAPLGNARSTYGAKLRSCSPKPERRSTRPRLPAFADWLGVIVDVDLFQSFNAVFHRFGRGFVF